VAPSETKQHGLVKPGRALEPAPLPRELAAEPAGLRILRWRPVQTDPPRSVTVSFFSLAVIDGQLFRPQLIDPATYRPGIASQQPRHILDPAVPSFTASTAAYRRRSRWFNDRKKTDRHGLWGGHADSP